MPIEYRTHNTDFIQRKQVEPPTYVQLTDFQVWFFIYVICYGYAPVNLQGVTKNMCLGVKMKLDYRKFDEEQIKLRNESEQLYHAGLFDITKSKVATGEYVLSEVGELYLFQEILGPIIKSKQKKKIQEIIDFIYTRKNNEDTQRVKEFITSIDLENPFDSFKSLSDKILKNAMPWLEALKEIHAAYRVVIGG